MRKPMVTRTLTSTKVTVLCLNTETCEPETQTVILARTYKDNATILKAVKSQIETEELSAVKVTSVEVIEKLYGMLEEDFVKYAEELDPKTRKAEETEE